MSNKMRCPFLNKVNLITIFALIFIDNSSITSGGSVQEGLLQNNVKDLPIVISGDNIQWARERGVLEIKENARIEYNFKDTAPASASSADTLLNNNRKMIISSKGPGRVNLHNGLAVFKKKVSITDGTTSLNARVVKIMLDSQTRKLIQIDAYGEVKIKDPQRTSYSKKAVYKVAEDIITLSGNPKIQSGLDTYAADIINIYEQGKRVTFEPRAKLVIYQETQHTQL